PVGNGIQWKMGVQDDIIGYEGNTDSANPNYTRSVGYSIEPTTLLGLVGTYQINSIITVQGGITENYTTTLVDVPEPVASTAPAEVSSKTLAGAVALTAPDSWGWVKGATLNLGVLLNPYKDGADNYYAGLTLPTPSSALKVGASFDLRSVANGNGNVANANGPKNPQNDSGWVVGLYGNYQATDKLSFKERAKNSLPPCSTTCGPMSPAVLNSAGIILTRGMRLVILAADPKPEMRALGIPTSWRSTSFIRSNLA
ncbi:MAG: outer membrane beta-barrel protein, partial [Verrucomicrobiota bacterium]